MLYRWLAAAWEPAGRLGLAGPGLRAILACATAFLTCLALGRPAIACLKRLKAQERTEKTPIEDDALRQRIAAKSGTPTMGGLLVLAGLLAAAMVWADVANPLVLLALGTALALGLFGLADDVLKLRGRGHRDRGFKARYKLIAQAVAGGALALVLLRTGPGTAWATATALGLTPAAAVAAAVAWGMFVVSAMSNGTNVTDGLDGLLAGLAPLAAIVLGGACWVAGNAGAATAVGLTHVAGAGELAVFCGALAGACLGFLCYNRHPARLFLGDTGSLAIGGGLAAAALAARQELLLGLVGVVFLAEFGSSLLQIAFFKVSSGRRILPVAPIHHIFEMRGDPEPAIVKGFYLWGAAAALIGLNLLCL